MQPCLAGAGADQEGRRNAPWEEEPLYPDGDGSAIDIDPVQTGGSVPAGSGQAGENGSSAGCMERGLQSRERTVGYDGIHGSLLPEWPSGGDKGGYMAGIDAAAGAVRQGWQAALLPGESIGSLCRDERYPQAGRAAFHQSTADRADENGMGRQRWLDKAMQGGVPDGVCRLRGYGDGEGTGGNQAIL